MKIERRKHWRRFFTDSDERGAVFAGRGRMALLTMKDVNEIGTLIDDYELIELELLYDVTSLADKELELARLREQLELCKQET